MEESRGNVWLAVAGLVLNKAGEWLVVKKKYGGLKGKWSLPAGFVKPGETVDEAVVREIREETGIEAEVSGIVGLRTGVIRGEVSDNMIIFLMRALTYHIHIQEKELLTAAFLPKKALESDPHTSALLLHLLQAEPLIHLPVHDGLNPGDPFGYTKYQVYFKNSKN
ncbi:NUDIX domain-containing protein [Anoxybacteroides tepidamans]|uniref:NUDIX domain-containing protein n=1 Tax=Anoxybacteroides tepidamans TaxID=265948 RepID=UPI0004816C00|nr:NUDIX domain-containing protein [Anoxybacillus tepidamans]